MTRRTRLVCVSEGDRAKERKPCIPAAEANLLACHNPWCLPVCAAVVRAFDRVDSAREAERLIAEARRVPRAGWGKRESVRLARGRGVLGRGRLRLLLLRLLPMLGNLLTMRLCVLLFAPHQNRNVHATSTAQTPVPRPRKITCDCRCTLSA